MTDTPILAEFLLPTTELRDDLPFFTKTLGMRLENIFPAQRHPRVDCAADASCRAYHTTP